MKAPRQGVETVSGERVFNFKSLTILRKNELRRLLEWQGILLKS